MAKTSGALVAVGVGVAVPVVVPDVLDVLDVLRVPAEPDVDVVVGAAAVVGPVVVPVVGPRSDWARRSRSRLAADGASGVPSSTAADGGSS
ncbi:MAG TPA: hypothetical protein VHO27_10490 [Angustibacter sp.]|nr:hypothetical protein [Angustibacter sp.]